MTLFKIFIPEDEFPKSFLPKVVNVKNEIFITKNILEADFILLPHWETLYEYSDEQYKDHGINPNNRKSIIETTTSLIERSKQHNKKLIVFFWSDSDESIPLENAIIFRTSINKSTQASNVISMPSWQSDLYEEISSNESLYQPKTEIPKVGFRGSSRPLSLNIEDLIRTGITQFNKMMASTPINKSLPYEWNVGQEIRRKAMLKLKENQRINSDFYVLTRGYLKRSDSESRRLNRQRFVESIFNNQYTLCVRGMGNYSYRLFETISAGRIPLFINTDCSLPLDFIIDWKKYMVWVEASDVNYIDEILLDFHSKHNSEEFINLQKKIRSLWDEYLKPTAYFNHMGKMLQKAMFNQSTNFNTVI